MPARTSTRRSGPREIGVAQLQGLAIKGHAVLINTGWDMRSDEDQLSANKPFVTRAAADWLAAQQPALVGIDVLNIDDLEDLSRPAHSALLIAGIPIVEHMRGLDQLPESCARFTAAPAAVEGLGTWPVRAFAIVQADD